MKWMLTAALALSVLVPTVFAQGSPPKPGAEHARIAYFAGEWKWEGEAKPSPIGPGWKTAGTDICEWFAGGFYLVCRGDEKAGSIVANHLSIKGYDPTEKTYTYYVINSVGTGIFERSTVSGPVWTSVSNVETKVDPKLMKWRSTTTEESPTSYAFKLEYSLDGGAWAVFEELKFTKTK